MKILITSVRLPFGLDMVRKFGEEGHEVYTAETFKTAPGSHSKFVKEHLIVRSPTYETRSFIDKLKDVITSRSIELVVPCFEEVFYIAAHVEEFSGLTDVFCASLDTLKRLHNKAAFVELTRELGIPIPRTATVGSQEELKEAVRDYEHFFARAAFSRGGVELLTNTGPLAGTVKLEDCHPTSKNPWLVQEYVCRTWTHPHRQRRRPYRDTAAVSTFKCLDRHWWILPFFGDGSCSETERLQGLS